MKKSRQIFIIIAVIVFAVGVGVFTLLNGVKAHNSHYIKIEVNPKIEFLTDANDIVASIYPLNEEAFELVIGEEFIGLNIKEACQKFLTLCAMANYIDVNSENNAINISVISGFTQALEMKVYESVHEFLLKNEIVAVIAENDNDLKMIKESKEKQISSPNKYALIKSVAEKDPTKTVDDLSNLTENDLIDMLETLHENYKENLNKFTPAQINNKTTLIDFNRINYKNHLDKISNDSQREFATKLEKFKKLNTQEYEIDFEESYIQWKEERTS